MPITYETIEIHVKNVGSEESFNHTSLKKIPAYTGSGNILIQNNSFEGIIRVKGMIARHRNILLTMEVCTPCRQSNKSMRWIATPVSLLIILGAKGGRAY